MASEPVTLRGALTGRSLDLASLIAEIQRPDCGGIATFVGTVRTSAAAPEAAGKPVVALEYEAHETLARDELEGLLDAAAAKWDLRAALAVHRLGRCDLGEPTVFVGCAAPHRADALEACRWLIDELKVNVPIFKKEIYADGSAWIGTGA